MTLLAGLRVVDLSTEIAGPYATKLLADAGADVVKVEGAEGDPLRSWTASRSRTNGRDGALFRYLNTSKRSLVGSIDDDHVVALLEVADLVVESGSLTDAELAALQRRSPQLIVTSVTPFGRKGPSASTAATEFTLQAWCGSTGGRGAPDRPPLHAGGRLGEWISGVYAAVGSLGAFQGRRGDHVDVSMLECMAVTLGGFGAVFASFAGSLEAAKSFAGPFRSVETPSIVATADGLVGICTVTGQQFQDFLVMIERADLIGDERFASALKRTKNHVEFDKVVGAWAATRTTEEIVDLGSAFRIPVTPIGTPTTITSIDQFVDRGVYVRSPDGDFEQPRVPYQVAGVEARPFTSAPALATGRAAIDWNAPPLDRSGGERSPGRPLEGVRVIDLTAFWAGPSATQMLAALGADVIKVEGLARPDGMRFNSARPPTENQWWEWSAMFHSVNAGKRGITLDLGTEEGRRLLLELIDGADAVIENFSPRVLDGFGITWDAVAERNPRAIMMRMPGFGLDGPWRDRTGFAQTMEQVSGMAWVSGHVDGEPVIPRGACDPLAGMHAVVAFLAALVERDRTGVGRFIEVSMVEAALNCAAEVVIEQSAYGVSLHRDGNRGPVAAPQGVYLCSAVEEWIAIAVVDDDQWSALVTVLGSATGLDDSRFDTDAARRTHHGELDSVLAAAVVGWDRRQLVEALLAEGVPAAPVLSTTALLDHPQLRARGFIESLDHSIAGRHDLLGVPFRLASRSEPWFETPAPTLGQHNHEVLAEALELSPDLIDALESVGVIGTSIPQ